MEIVTEPLTEEEVLAVTFADIDADSIVVNMETKAQCCVDHLCGCSK
jgi:hypothetical protein